jgi:DNA polymerase III epsilon subunit-like protein
MKALVAEPAFLRNSTVGPMSSEDIDLEKMAEILAQSPDYRVLRKLIPSDEFAACNGQTTKTGILLDVETTGLNTAQDEVIELAMVKFTYLPDDRIAAITDMFSSTNHRFRYRRKSSSSLALRMRWCRVIESIPMPLPPSSPMHSWS